MTTMYYKLSPEQIVKDISRFDESKKVKIKGKEFFVYPHVYPSDKFRTTNFILDNIEPLLHGASVCDMGCGMGIIGLFAMQHGAKRIVQVDINPLAIENAKANRALYHYSDEQVKIFESNCFDNVPTQMFDLVIFNIPFHSEPYKIEDPLEYAFHDPNFASTIKFLRQVVAYCNSKTKILIAFSNKGDVQTLETIFDNTNFNWKLWKIINTNQEYDNRIYKLQVNERCLSR